MQTFNELSNETKNYEDNILQKFFEEFLDESSFSQFREAERLIVSLKSQGRTISGYPLIRPADCGRIIATLEQIFLVGQSHFRTRDPQFTERFELLISEFRAFCEKVYPSEAIGAIILHGKVRLFMGDAARAIALVDHYARRPYAVEGGPENCLKLVEIFAQAHLQLGTLRNQNMSFVAFGRWLAGFRAVFSSSQVAARMAPFVAFGADPEENWQVRAIKRASIAYFEAATGDGRWRKRVIQKIRKGWHNFVLGHFYTSMARRDRDGGPFDLGRNKHGTVLVTRGMGGIGDLLMMAPGLEALVKKHGAPVHFAIPKKFHALFKNNPHVHLLDIDGPPIEMKPYRSWINLTICPAGRYEARHRPNIRKGRVEIFARAMRINKKSLNRQGWRVRYFISDDEEKFCNEYLKNHDLGRRKLIGIQPFSRDSYKDHARISSIVKAISDFHDVIIFHHVSDGLPKGPGIHSTAGVSLGNSVALVSKVDAMVAVDSAFLHAAAAFDVPVVALFGPTDARTFTRHHKRVKILWKPEFFGCVPCWRNEDMDCVVSGLKTMSPCVGMIDEVEVLAALDEMLQPVNA